MQKGFDIWKVTYSLLSSISHHHTFSFLLPSQKEILPDCSTKTYIFFHWRQSSLPIFYSQWRWTTKDENDEECDVVEWCHSWLIVVKCIIVIELVTCFEKWLTWKNLPTYILITRKKKKTRKIKCVTERDVMKKNKPVKQKCYNPAVFSLT